MYIKNKYKKDKRIASKKEAKQIQSLYNNIAKESQQLNNVMNLAKIFINNNNELILTDNDFTEIVKHISLDISPFPLSKACLEHGGKLLKDYYNSLKKKNNVEKNNLE